jgi:DNA-binding transcriptional ArsR family regulator
MIDVEVIDDPIVATVALDPVRSRLLSELATPASAATLAERMGIPRQKINYHLRTLEAHGLVEVATERMWGGLKERLMVATATAYIVSPATLGQVAVSPEEHRDRLSASYLIALAARAIREISRLLRLSRQSGKRLATLSIDTDVRFRSAEDRAKFTDELMSSVNSLIARYHDPISTNGRRHRLVILSHPLLTEETNEARHGEEK